MQTNPATEFQAGTLARLTFDLFDGRGPVDTTGQLVEITEYGGFEQISIQVQGVRHGATCVSFDTLIACDENGRPLTEAVERRFAALDREQERLDAKREELRRLVASMLDS